MNTLVIIGLLLLALCAFCVIYYCVFIRPKTKVKKNNVATSPPMSPVNSPPSTTDVNVPHESEYITTKSFEVLPSLPSLTADPITNEPIDELSISESAESLIDDLTGNLTDGTLTDNLTGGHVDALSDGLSDDVVNVSINAKATTTIDDDSETNDDEHVSESDDEHDNDSDSESEDEHDDDSVSESDDGSDDDSVGEREGRSDDEPVSESDKDSDSESESNGEDESESNSKSTTKSNQKSNSKNASKPAPKTTFVFVPASASTSANLFDIANV